MVIATRPAGPLGEAPAALPPQADPNWDCWQLPRHGDTDAATARLALEQRIEWRLANPDRWRGQLAQLAYFDPAYVYDEGHEYEDDWTTDPHLTEGVRHKILDEDGFVSPDHYKHGDLISVLLAVFRSLLGNRVEREPELHFDPGVAKRAGMYTEGGNLSTQVEPDIVVVPDRCKLPTGKPRGRAGRTMRLNAGHPVPELIVEVLSPSTRRKDQEEKRLLYADLGVAEYLTIDPGGEPEGASAVLRFHRLEFNPETKAYEYKTDTWNKDNTYRSDVCGTLLRLIEPDAENAPPRFQWKDEQQNRWRDPDADKLREGRAEGVAIGVDLGVIKGVVQVMHDLLDGVIAETDRDDIAAVWRAHGLPEGATERILAVRDAPETWRSLLAGEADRDGDTRDDRPPKGW
jgi:hypothetical protein